MRRPPWVVLLLLSLATACGAPEPPPPNDDDASTDDDDAVDDDDDAVDDDDDDAVDDDDDAVDDDDATPPDDDDTTAPPPHLLADVVLYINLGDSIAAGAVAAGENGIGGGGYARLITSNQTGYPAYDDHHLEAVAPGIDFRDLGDGGATSDDILDNLEGALSGLPSSAAGDVLVTISAGGNDFNDSIWTMVTPALTEAAAATVRANLAEMVVILRDRYEDSDTELFIVFLDIQDPTDGEAAIPPEFDDGFCEALQNPAFTLVGETVLANLGIMNTAIADEATASGAMLAGYYDHFQGHGMNADPPGDRWMSDDCAHPMDIGHHQLRVLIWELLTGDAP